jgi:hypothetical protein
VRVSDEVLKCVGFVSKGENIFDYRGTAFIVSVPHDESSGCLHLVTAKHVALAIPSGEACIAVNAKDGLPRWMKQGDTPWFFHPTDPSVDVAVLPMASGMIHAYDVRDIPVQMFATKEVIEQEKIGLGDELVNVGLFRPFPGSSGLLEAIVRTGNIAMMPKSRIPSDMFGSLEAYLAEGRSIGGLSGSPVFVRSTVNMNVQNYLGEPVQMSGLGPMRLIGLIHGHWDSAGDFGAEVQKPVNMGVSIIVPADKILEVLYSPELCAAREEAFKRWAPGFVDDPTQ